MKSRCVECKAKSEDGILEHLDNCSAINFKPIISHGTMPPATEIIFESEEERKNFLNNIGNSGGTGVTPNNLKEGE